MEHIYMCRILNDEIEIKVEYENLYRGNVKNLKEILSRFEIDIKKRQQHTHVILCDHLVSYEARIG